VTSKPIVVYPNSGETYIAETNEWVVRFFDNVAFGTNSCDNKKNFGLVLTRCSLAGLGRRGGNGLRVERRRVEVGGRRAHRRVLKDESPATVRAIARAVREADADEYDDIPAVPVL